MRLRSDANLALPDDPLFELAPISLWLEDFSEVHEMMQRWRAAGVTDVRRFLAERPEGVRDFFRSIRLLDVNRRTLSMYGARSLAELVAASDRLFDTANDSTAASEIEHVWNDSLTYSSETINYRLDGTPLHVRVNVNRLADVERPWDRVLVAVEDFSEQKRAAEKLEYLSTHDPLTTLLNRAAFERHLERVGRIGPFPLAILAVDLNGLKAQNDSLGHAAGDELLKRTAQLLLQTLPQDAILARMGGDEFAALLPGTDAFQMNALCERLREAAHGAGCAPPARESALSFSVGAHVCGSTDQVPHALREADRKMYEAKRLHYLANGDRRRAS